MGRTKSTAEQNTAADEGEVLQHEVASGRSSRCGLGFLPEPSVRGKLFSKTEIFGSLETLSFKTPDS